MSHVNLFTNGDVPVGGERACLFVINACTLQSSPLLLKAALY